MTVNRKHYSNIAREPHEGDVVQYTFLNGTKSDPGPVTPFCLARPHFFELVQPWWDVDAKPGAKWKDIHGCVFTKQDNGYWSTNGPGTLTAVQLEDYFGPGELVIIDPDQPTGLTKRQREALKTAESGLEHADLVDRAERLRNAFPEVFAEPDSTGGDPVVLARVRDSNPLELFYRCTDGLWSLHPGRESGPWTTDMLQGIRRLQPATIADLMNNATKEES